MGFRNAAATFKQTHPHLNPPLEGEDFKAKARGFRSMSDTTRSEEHTSELQSLMRISYAVFCVKKKKNKQRKKNVRHKNRLHHIRCTRNTCDHKRTWKMRVIC